MSTNTISLVWWFFILINISISLIYVWFPTIQKTNRLQVMHCIWMNKPKIQFILIKILGSLKNTWEIILYYTSTYTHFERFSCLNLNFKYHLKEYVDNIEYIFGTNLRNKIIKKMISCVFNMFNFIWYLNTIGS